ncbi:GAF domain-containing protein [Arthrobacter cheniae]|uniref:GAF domain-containing protein n=1 Tax=Arthrobacter cheniae TaxID=1258888 RepID=A0A3A5LYR6_9MICC|nr:GAF domain-containing protein [Arthrobacter cheniae]RJT74886.1 GAF domain-containing protein [Arthrobacter cheniae]
MREVLSVTGLALEDVWISYYGMGGLVSRFELEAYLAGLLVLGEEQCDILADATNDLLSEVGAKDRIRRCSDDSAAESAVDSRRELGAAGAFLFTPEEQEQERLDAVTRTQLLDTDHEERFDRITQEAKDYFEVSSAIVTLIDDRRQFLKSVIGPIQQDMPREISFCNATIRNAGPLIVRDALEDERFSQNPLVLGEPHIRFYAGYPLRGPGGWTIGTLCVIDQQPREYSMRDGRKLRTLARRVEDEINGPGPLPDSESQAVPEQ